MLLLLFSSSCCSTPWYFLLCCGVPVVEVGYDQFLEMIDNEEVREISYDEYSGQFVFIAEKDNTEQIYKTGIWPEDGQRLLQQLMEHEDIKFSATIPTQTDPLLSFI